MAKEWQLSLRLPSSRFPKRKSDDQVKTEKLLMAEQTEIGRRYGHASAPASPQSTNKMASEDKLEGEAHAKRLKVNTYAESKGK